MRLVAKPRTDFSIVYNWIQPPSSAIWVAGFVELSGEQWMWAQVSLRSKFDEMPPWHKARCISTRIGGDIRCPIKEGMCSDALRCTLFDEMIEGAMTSFTSFGIRPIVEVLAEKRRL